MNTILPYRWLGLLLILLLSTFKVGSEPEEQIILVVGDSLSAAYGMHPAEGWVSLLDKRLENQSIPYQVVNISTSGDTTSNGLFKLRKALEEYHPKIVILGLGSNDGLRGLNPVSIRKNIKEMIELSKKEGAEVLLIGFLVPTNYGKKYSSQFEAIFNDLAREFKIRRIPFLLHDVILNPDLILADQLHPNSKAQPIILETVWSELKPMLKK